MNIVKTAAAIAIFACAGTVMGEQPDPNPRPNADGTSTWFVGNNTQYPVIQDVLDACSDGDEIVVTAGLYVESLEITRSDVTLRPVALGTASTAAWADVTFWNPTEGFNNANGYAIRMTGGNNTYVGRPRQITQLANGLEVANSVPVLNNTDQDATSWAWQQDQTPAQVSSGSNGVALTFWSRSIDNVAVYSTDGNGTFEDCYITSSNGFGGGIICSGTANTTQFVGCNLNSTFATGNALSLADGSTGPACNVVTITGGAPQFISCDISDNMAGSLGIVNDSGSKSRWDMCTFSANSAPAADGMYSCGSSTPDFMRCTFSGNTSNLGTVCWDAAGQAGPDMMNFNRCNFTQNTTANNGGTGQMYGGVAYVRNATAGGAPLINFSACGVAQNNGASAPATAAEYGLNTGDIDSDWFPRYRIGDDFLLDVAANWSAIQDTPGTVTPGDMNGDGSIDASDLDEMHGVLGTCHYDGDLSGNINIEDLLGVLSVYGGSCN
tara:strand:+ start:336 stop:1820 length:1485 start_codon:yes stop_codon:yes gene_type:complete